MLEIGTGSGCLSITLARLFPQWKVHACDISGAAHRVARNNASLHRCRAHPRFHRGDLFDGDFLAHETFNVIISNPLYISDEERSRCGRSIFYEPSIALFVRPPLKFYAKISGVSRKCSVTGYRPTLFRSNFRVKNFRSSGRYSVSFFPSHKEKTR
jgi:release factor glutamine methyltransferase